MGKVPFKDILIHGTVLTKDGKRMSKSLGTGIDPLKYIDEFGADATRFGVIWQSTGQDIRWDESAVLAGKKFANKVWNAAKFVLKQTENISTKRPAIKIKENADILEKLEVVKTNVGKEIESFEFSKALHDIYNFFWHEFCDIYIEKSKDLMADNKAKNETLNTLSFVMFESLKLLHPFMPFLTEEIYQRFPLEKKEQTIMIESWNRN